MAALPEPTDDDYPTYKMDVSLHADLHEDADWFAPYVQEIDVYISQQWSTDSDQVFTRNVGSASAILFHVGQAINDEICIVEAADDHGNDAHDYCSAVIRPRTNSWRKSIEKQFDEQLFEHDVLAIMEVNVAKEHRGNRLGQLAVLRLMQMFESGCGLTVIKPWPLQYMATQFREIAETGTSKEGWTDQTKRNDFEKLRRYWGAMGFERLGKTSYFGFPGFRPLPRFEKFCGNARTVINDDAA